MKFVAPIIVRIRENHIDETVEVIIREVKSVVQNFGFA